MARLTFNTTNTMKLRFTCYYSDIIYNIQLTETKMVNPELTILPPTKLNSYS